jgi:hypothetical protein
MLRRHLTKYLSMQTPLCHSIGWRASSRRARGRRARREATRYFFQTFQKLGKPRRVEAVIPCSLGLKMS